MRSLAMSSVASYVERLPHEAKNRYAEKTRIIGGLDPFVLFSDSGRSTLTKGNLPPIEASDIVAYLVLQTSFITTKQFKAYKSMEAYNQFVNGWVKEVNAWNVDDKIVVTGRVRHSQRCNETPLHCWIICTASGEVCCAHCNCMAGLGEACTHVGVVLFYLETATRINEKTCTQQKCQWAIPSFQQNIPYLPVNNIDFSSAKKQHKMLNCSGSEQSADHVNTESATISSWPGSSSLQSRNSQGGKLDVFFETLAGCGTKPGILSLLKEHSDPYIPHTDKVTFPKPLDQLYDKKYLSYGYLDLLKACDETVINITQEMCDLVEQETRGQSNSKLWFEYRAGRITASRMKSACHTDSSNPSQSLVKVIVYPEAFQFRSSATQWGCKHEKKARSYYEGRMKSHDDFSLVNSGLCINPQWPHIGASPDGRVDCKCCGKGVVEIKCPYCFRNDDLDSKVADKKGFCLSKDCDGNLFLDHGHAYYYQVQTQIFVCNVAYCDFVVCTFPENMQDPSIHVERIVQDIDFWSSCVDTVSLFFKVCILPEILSRWYSRPQTSCKEVVNKETESSLLEINTSEQAGSSSQSTATSSLYCYCNQPESGQMIACDSSVCKIEWFHMNCLRIKSIPKGKWYCPSCRVLPDLKKGKKRSRQN